MDEVVPEAYFDALYIFSDAPASLASLSVVELHLFAYLSCILALFHGHAVSDWGYTFAITTEGFPFSAQVEIARKKLIDLGFVSVDGRGTMSASRDGRLEYELEVMASLISQGDRRRWSRAATECALAFPIGAIRHAMSHTPGISVPFALRQRSVLLEDSDVGLLYGEYEVVREALGNEVADTLTPAIIWLSARVLSGEAEHV